MNLEAQLNEIRERANGVLDGMTRNRDRVARDCLNLCGAVERLNKAVKEKKPDTDMNWLFKGLGL